MKRWLLALMLACCAMPALATDEAPLKQVMLMLRLPPPHFRADASYSGAYRNDSGRVARRTIASELARTHGLTLVSDWPMASLGIDCYVLALPPGGDPARGDPARVATLLANDARVEWAQPVATFHVLGQADPLYQLQPAARAWHLDELHRVAVGRDVRVAVVDSGVDARHPDLAGQVMVQENFIDAHPYVAENHGTAVAAIIAAREGHGGILGVAPGARLLALRACHERPDAATQCDSFSLGKALNFAILREAQVINMSLTGPPDRLLQRLLDLAQARGIKVVAASDPASADGGFPASWHGVFAVGDEALAGRAALLAPGRDIPTAVPDVRWGFVSGPSFAAAHVSGLLALLIEVEPGVSAARLRSELTSSLPGLVKIGASGVIDACAAVSSATGRCTCSCPISGAPVAAPLQASRAQ